MLRHELDSAFADVHRGSLESVPLPSPHSAQVAPAPSPAQPSRIRSATRESIAGDRPAGSYEAQSPRPGRPVLAAEGHALTRGEHAQLAREMAEQRQQLRQVLESQGAQARMQRQLLELIAKRAKQLAADQGGQGQKGGAQGLQETSDQGSEREWHPAGMPATEMPKSPPLRGQIRKAAAAGRGTPFSSLLQQAGGLGRVLALAAYKLDQEAVRFVEAIHQQKPGGAPKRVAPKRGQEASRAARVESGGPDDLRVLEAELAHETRLAAGLAQLTEAVQAGSVREGITRLEQHLSGTLSGAAAEELRKGIRQLAEAGLKEQRGEARLREPEVHRVLADMSNGQGAHLAGDQFAKTRASPSRAELAGDHGEAAAEQSLDSRQGGGRQRGLLANDPTIPEESSALGHTRGEDRHPLDQRSGSHANGGQQEERDGRRGDEGGLRPEVRAGGLTWAVSSKCSSGNLHESRVVCSARHTGTLPLSGSDRLDKQVPIRTQQTDSAFTALSVPQHDNFALLRHGENQAEAYLFRTACDEGLHTRGF